MNNKNLGFTSRTKLRLRSLIKTQILVQLALHLLIIRLIIRLYDFENSMNDHYERGKWVITILFYTSLLRFCIELYFLNYELKHILSKILGLIYIEVGLISQITENQFVKYKEYKYEHRLGQVNGSIINNKAILYCTVLVIGFVFWLFLLIH